MTHRLILNFVKTVSLLVDYSALVVVVLSLSQQ